VITMWGTVKGVTESMIRVPGNRRKHERRGSAGSLQVINISRWGKGSGIAVDDEQRECKLRATSLATAACIESEDNQLTLGTSCQGDLRRLRTVACTGGAAGGVLALAPVTWPQSWKSTVSTSVGLTGAKTLNIPFP